MGHCANLHLLIGDFNQLTFNVITDNKELIFAISLFYNLKFFVFYI